MIILCLSLCPESACHINWQKLCDFYKSPAFFFFQHIIQFFSLADPAPSWKPEVFFVFIRSFVFWITHIISEISRVEVLLQISWTSGKIWCCGFLFKERGGEVVETGCIVHRRCRKTHACQPYWGYKNKRPVPQNSPALQYMKHGPLAAVLQLIQQSFKGLSTLIFSILNSKTTDTEIFPKWKP